MNKETNNQNNEEATKKEEGIMRIRIKRTTFLATQFEFKNLNSSTEIMEAVCREVLTSRKSKFLDLLDKINIEGKSNE